MVLSFADDNYKAFAGFVNELDQYQQKCSNFFDYDLLDLLETHLGFKHGGITAYDQTRYLGCIGRHRIESLAEYHFRDYHKRDPIAKFITAKKENLLCPIIRATDVFSSENFSDSEYSNFLQIAGMHYVAIMVFPQHRVILYREANEGDFTDSEIDNITSLHSIIEQKRKAHVDHKKQTLANQTKNAFMDQLHIGFIVFDQNGATVEYNHTALRYLNIMFKRDNLQNIFADILAVMNSTGNTRGEAITQQYQGFTISMTSVVSIDSFGLVKTHYSISISQTSRQTVPAGNHKNPQVHQFKTLTAREKEVLDAYCDGDTYNNIAKALFISENTVRSHLKSIYRKLDVTNQRALIKLYCQYNSLPHDTR